MRTAFWPWPLWTRNVKGTCSIRTPDGQQSLLYVTEAGLHDLCFSSRKTKNKGSFAHRLKRWGVKEVLPVLPSIRKTGGYGVAAEPSKSVRAEKTS